jgi:hypothetical protein
MRRPGQVCPYLISQVSKYDPSSGIECIFTNCSLLVSYSQPWDEVYNWTRKFQKSSRFKTWSDWMSAAQGQCLVNQIRIGQQCVSSSIMFGIIVALAAIVGMLLLLFRYKTRREALKRAQGIAEWTIKVRALSLRSCLSKLPRSPKSLSVHVLHK